MARLRRWLKNPQVQVWDLYQPILDQVARPTWREVDAFVILDGWLVFGNRWPVFRLSLEHGWRAIPSAWVILPGAGLVQAEKLSALLGRAEAFLALRVKSVTLIESDGLLGLCSRPLPPILVL